MGKWASRNVARVIAQESELIRVSLLGATGYEQYPDETTEIALRGGRDGLDGITPDDVIGYNNGPDARYGSNPTTKSISSPSPTCNFS